MDLTKLCLDRHMYFKCFKLESKILVSLLILQVKAFIIPTYLLDSFNSNLDQNFICQSNNKSIVKLLA